MKEPAIITLCAILGASSGDALETHGISLGTAAAVGAIVLPAAWWIGRNLQRIIDRLEAVERKVDALPCVKPRNCEKDL